MTAINCPHCPRVLQDENAAQNHLRDKHRAIWNSAHARRRRAAKRQAEREPSIADLMVDAEMNRAMGIRNPDWLEDMLP